MPKQNAPKQNNPRKSQQTYTPADIRMVIEITGTDWQERMRRIDEARAQLSKLMFAELAAVSAWIADGYAEDARKTADPAKRAELKHRAQCLRQSSRTAAKGAV